MGRASDLTAEERAEIVLALLRREEPMSVLSKRYGVSETTLGRWRDDFIASGTQGLGSGKRRRPGEQRRVARLEAEVAERDRVIGELTIANRILKKNSFQGG
jgi:transposase-like protein